MTMRRRRRTIAIWVALAAAAGMFAWSAAGMAATREAFRAAPMPPGVRVVLTELDGQLGRLNVEYAQKRNSQRLNTPELWLMKAGWFERSIRAKQTTATRDVQFKPQLLTTTLEETSELMLIVELAKATTNKP